MIKCDCNDHLFSPSEYNNHILSMDHQKYTKKLKQSETCEMLSDCFNFLTIICYCGETYDFKNQYKHFSRSQFHKQWKLLNPELDNQVLMICYCGEVYHTFEFDNHKNKCKQRVKMMDLYKSKKEY